MQLGAGEKAVKYWKIATATLALVTASPGFTQAPLIQPNSKFIIVPPYQYPDGNGNWSEYRAIGYAQPPIAGEVLKLFLLPHLRVTDGDVKFFDSDGNNFDPLAFPAKAAVSVTVRARQSVGMPSEQQQPAIGAALTGEKAQRYLAPWPKVFPFGPPVMYNGFGFNADVSASITNAYTAYDAEVAKLDTYRATYKSYAPQSADLNELRIALLIDGEEVAVRLLSKSVLISGNILPGVTLQKPTGYQKTKIANGDYELTVGYRFTDAKTSSIQARFDAAQAAKLFLEETQNAVTKNKSTGWQVFGIGSRRSKIKSSLEQSMKAADETTKMEGTRIVMNDADDEMVQRFENAFFPEISRQDVIANHLAAAEKAQAAGDFQLAAVHRDYAAAMQADNKLQEVDAVGAAASLTAGDYAGFIAKGVRFSQNNNVATNNFRRTVDLSVSSTLVQEWNEVKTVSAQRETTAAVLPEKRGRFGPSLGVFGADSRNYSFVTFDQYSGFQLQNRSSLLLTGLIAGGAFANSGLLPGMLIKSIDGQSPKTIAELTDVARQLQPGELVEVIAIESFGSMPTPFMQGFEGKETKFSVRVGRVPTNPDDADRQ